MSLLWLLVPVGFILMAWRRLARLSGRWTWCVDSWMTAPFYALIFEEEVGFWRSRKVYPWRIHIYGGIDHRDMLFTAKGEEADYDAALASINREIWLRGARYGFAPAGRFKEKE